MTASLGIATFPLDGLTGGELFCAADGMLYQAKLAGRNCTRVARCGSD